MRSAVGILALLALSACASGPTTRAEKPLSEQLARELLSSSPPSLLFRSLQEDIYVDQVALDAMRDRAELRGHELVAVAILPAGVHPYIVVAFVRQGRRLDVFGTLMYWGMVQEKWRTETQPRFLSIVSEQASETFRCHNGSPGGPLYGVYLVSWTSGEQIVCDGGWFTEESSRFRESFSVLVESASLLYAYREAGS